MVDMCKTIENYPDANGAMPLLYSLRDCIPFAWDGLLVILFFILFAGNYFIIKSKTGKAKVLTALLSSTFVTLILSMFLALSQLVGYNSVLFWAFMTIIWFILFLVSDNN